MKMTKRFLQYTVSSNLILIFVLCLLTNPAYSESTYSILHRFGSTGDGFQPYYGGPAISGSAIYGMTQGGGLPTGGMTAGVLYKINADGTGYTVLHNFYNCADPPTGDGTVPRGGLTLSGSTLYGCCAYGGTPYIHTYGTVFKINTNGSGYQVIHNFWQDTNNQATPYAAPVVSGNRLYGTTVSALTGLHGEIFTMNTDGTAFQVLHEFAGKPDDGATPYGSMTLIGSTLYGMTFTGGHNGIDGGGSGYGTIFKIDTDGNNYMLLHHFAGYPNDGTSPFGALTVVGSRLYGMASGGGAANGPGVIFSLNLDGSDYKVVVDLSTVSGAIGGPYGSLALVGTVLYGMTSGGGPGGASGVIFQINTDGTGFQILHSFMPAQGDGGMPLGDLSLYADKLYGWTYANGSYNGGVLFSYRISLPNPQGVFNIIRNRNGRISITYFD